MVRPPTQLSCHPIAFVARVAKEQSALGILGQADSRDDTIRNGFLEIADLDWDHRLGNFRAIRASSEYLVNRPAELFEKPLLRAPRACGCHKNDGDGERPKKRTKISCKV